MALPHPLELTALTEIPCMAGWAVAVAGVESTVRPVRRGLVAMVVSAAAVVEVEAAVRTLPRQLAVEQAELPAMAAPTCGPTSRMPATCAVR